MEGKPVEYSAAFWTQHSLYPLAVVHCLTSIPHRDGQWAGKGPPAVFPRIQVTVSRAYPTLSSCVCIIHATKFFCSYFVFMQELLKKKDIPFEKHALQHLQQ